MASYFHGVIDFVGSHPHFALIAVFLLALSEAIPVVGTVVPGSTSILGISALATTADINPWVLLIAATVGAIVGDGLSFWLGKRYHQEILGSWPINRYPQLIERSKAFIDRYGIGSVFLARFTAIVRAFVPLLAGVLRMSTHISMPPTFCSPSCGHPSISILVSCSRWRSASLVRQPSTSSCCSSLGWFLHQPCGA